MRRELSDINQGLNISLNKYEQAGVSLPVWKESDITDFNAASIQNAIDLEYNRNKQEHSGWGLLLTASKRIQRFKPVDVARHMKGRFLALNTADDVDIAIVSADGLLNDPKIAKAKNLDGIVGIEQGKQLLSLSDTLSEKEMKTYGLTQSEYDQIVLRMRKILQESERFKIDDCAITLRSAGIRLNEETSRVSREVALTAVLWAIDLLPLFNRIPIPHLLVNQTRGDVISYATAYTRSDIYRIVNLTAAPHKNDIESQQRFGAVQRAHGVTCEWANTLGRAKITTVLEKQS